MIGRRPTPSEIDALRWFTALELSEPLAGWHLLLTPEPAELARELGATLELFEVPAQQVEAADLSAHLEHPAEGALLITGIETLSDEHLQWLDTVRARLQEVAPFLVLCMDLDTAGRLHREAPNLASFFTGLTRTWLPEDEEAAEQTRTTHLEALRAQWGETDEQVIARAEAGELPAEPDYYLWIALLGRGDLLDRVRHA